MVLSITLVLLVIALILTVISAMGKLPLWPAMLFVIVVLLLSHLPLR